MTSYLDQIINENKTNNLTKEIVENIVNESIYDDLTKGNIKNAKECCEKVLKEFPNNPKLLNVSAIINAKEGQINDALINIDKALQNDQNNDILKNNKIVLMSKKFEDNKYILTDNDKKFFKNQILENQNDDIKKKAIEESIKLIEEKKKN